jgi:hypothetical protein
LTGRKRVLVMIVVEERRGHIEVGEEIGEN